MPRRRRPNRPGALADLAPLRILTQIIILQAAYYVCAAVLLVFTALVAGRKVKLDLLLSWRSLRGDITVGWTLGLAWMLNSLICVVFLLLLVARSKLIPDFALTIHFFHLIITSFYSHSIPKHWFWWALQVASVSLMTFLGVWACQWRELKPISFGAPVPGRSEQHGSNSRGISNGNIGFGFGRGRRGGDGGGNYEMVSTKDRDDMV